MSQHLVRRLNAPGIDRFRALLLEATVNGWADFNSLLEDPAYTELLTPAFHMMEPTTWTRKVVGESLFEDLRHLDNNGSLDQDTGLWAWLSLLWIDKLALDSKGRRHVAKDFSRYIPSQAYNRFHRHLLRLPYMIYREHSGHITDVMVLMYQDVNVPGEISENIAARQEILTSPSILAAATRLYYDPATGKAKDGAASKGAGTARRLGVMFLQYLLTWDLSERTPEQILELLPAEFDRFKN